MQIEKNIPVKSNFHNKPIVTDVFYLSTKKPKPIVIFCHGYKGYKDWGAWNLAAEQFASNNLFFVKFNFSHNGGTLENPIDFPDLDAFGKNNFSLELDDLETIIQWIRSHTKYQEEVDSSKVILIGHSRGGGIVSIKAFENKNIAKIISWAGVSDFEKRFPSGEKLNYWKQQGISHILNTRTNQQMPHYFQFYEDFIANKERFTIHKAVKRISVPHLIIHGKNDQVVPLEEAENLHEWNPKSELHIIEEMDHALGCTQPWTQEKMPFFLEQVVIKTIDFINDK